MPFDLDSYRKRLETAQQAIGADAVSGMSGGTMQIPEPQMPQIGAGPEIGAAPTGMAPNSALQPTPNQRRMKSGRDTVRNGRDMARPQFDADKLEGAKTVGDVIDAMPSQSRNQYLKQWEAQYGAINTKYNAILQELGQRPEVDRKVSRKEMFKAVMEFGLNVMKNSQVTNENPQGDDGDGATNAIVSAVRGMQQDRQVDQQRHDVIGAQVRGEKAAALKELGPATDAIEKQNQMDLRDSQIAKNNAYRPPGSKKQVLTTDQGVMDISGDRAKPMIGEDGTRLTRKTVSGSGGRIPDTRPSEQKKYEHLLSIGTPKDAAKVIAYRQPTGDPRKDKLAVFNSVIRSGMGAEDAKEVSEAYINMNYGADEMESAKTPLINRKPGEAAPKRRTRTWDDSTGTMIGD